MKNLTALKKLSLIKCKGLEALPRCLGQLTCLEKLSIHGRPNLTSLPKSIKNLTTLTAFKRLRLIGCKGLEALPGWLGQLTCLEDFFINEYPNLTYLLESMMNLTALKKWSLTECKGMKAIVFLSTIASQVVTYSLHGALKM